MVNSRERRQYLQAENNRISRVARRGKIGIRSADVRSSERHLRSQRKQRGLITRRAFMAGLGSAGFFVAARSPPRLPPREQHARLEIGVADERARASVVARPVLKLLHV